jgi:hypothetical protein
MLAATKVEGTIEIPKSQHKYLIGVSGATLVELQTEAGEGVRIVLPKKEDPPSVTTIHIYANTPQQVKKAKKLILSTLSKVQGEKEAVVQETEAAYLEHQKAVDALAKRRGDLFQEASKAFERGDKAKAKALSEEGHRVADQMKLMQEKAADAVYAKRLRIVTQHPPHSSPSPSSSSSIPSVDLHGLHTADALRILEKEITRLTATCVSSSSSDGILKVVTGKGLHSAKDKGPQLKPSVEQYFTSHGIHYRKDPDEASFIILQFPKKK